MLVDQFGNDVKLDASRLEESFSLWETVRAFAQEETFWAASKEAFPRNEVEIRPDVTKEELIRSFLNDPNLTNPQRLKLISSRNMDELRANLAVIEDSAYNERVLQLASGPAQLASLMTVAVADPTNLLPAGWFKSLMNTGKIARLGKATSLVIGRRASVKTAVGVGGLALAEEGVIRKSNPNREILDSILTIGGAGAIGFGLGKIVDAKSMRRYKLNQKIESSFRVQDEKGVLSPRAKFDDRPAPALGLEHLAEFTSPLVRLLTSPSQVLRRYSHEIMTTGFFTRSNLDEVASPISLESEIAGSWNDYTSYMGVLENSWLEMVRGQGGGTIARMWTDRIGRHWGGEKFMSFSEFDSLVTRYRAGAITDVPDEVKTAAQAMDSFFKKWEQEASAIWEGEATEGISNYINRRWNVAEIANKQDEFLDFLMAEWRASDDYVAADALKVKSIFRNTIKKMVVNPSERIVLDDIFDETVRGSFKMRYFNFIDEANLYNTDWVLHSSKDAISGYTKSVIADILFHRKFGTLSMREVMKNVRSEVLSEFEYHRDWRKVYPNLDESTFKIVYDADEGDIGGRLRPHRDPNAPLPAATTRTNSDGTKTVFIDRNAAKLAYQRKAWLNPKVKGVTPIDRDFTEQDWEDFLLFHELDHVETPTIRLNEDGTPRKRTQAEIAADENAANQRALEKLDQMKAEEAASGQGKYLLDDEEFKLLNKELELFEAMLGRVRGTYMSPHSPLPGSVTSRSIDALMKFNNLRLGGGFLLSSFVDIGRPVMMMGIKQSYGPAVKAFLLNDKELRNQMGAASAELRAWAIGNELHYSQRLQSMIDQVPVTSSVTRAERILGQANDEFFILNGLTIWNEYMKKNAGIAVMDKIITSAFKSRDGKLGKKLRQNLAQMGLDANDLRKIADEFEVHGHTLDNVHITDYANWSNDEVAKKLFEAVRKEVDTIILTPGVGDTPLIMSNQFVAMVAQYKTFALAATTKMLLRGMQVPDANFMNGLLISVMAGAAVTGYKDLVAGRDRDWSGYLEEGISRSGILASIGEANSILGNTPLGNLAITGYGGRHGFNSFALGPSAGAFMDSMDLLSAASGGGMDEQAQRALYRLTPYHNLFYVTNLLELLNGE